MRLRLLLVLGCHQENSVNFFSCVQGRRTRGASRALLELRYFENLGAKQDPQKVNTKFVRFLKLKIEMLNPELQLLL